MAQTIQTAAEVARRAALTNAQRTAEDNAGYEAVAEGSQTTVQSEAVRRAALTQSQRDAEDSVKAKDVRVAAVTADIAAAQAARDASAAATGLTETPGARADREAAEKLALATAGQVRAIELIEGSSTDFLTNELIRTVNKVVTHVNGF